MQNVINLVFIKHPNNSKNYLFQVPMGIDIAKDETVYCDTMHGKSTGVAVTDSFYIDLLADFVVNGTGAYSPLKMVLGRIERWAETKTVEVEYPFELLEDLPF